MAEMTKEILLSGTKFRNVKGMGLFFSCKVYPENYALLTSLTSVGESVYFGNISKIDSKGFNYYTYDFLGKRKLSARVKFADLIAFPNPKSEILNHKSNA